MAAVLFLAVSFLNGEVLSGIILDKKQKEGSSGPLWVCTAVSFGIGVMLTTWLLYFLAFLFHEAMGIENPLLPANFIILSSGTVLHICRILKIRKNGNSSAAKPVTDKKLFRKECVWYGFLFLFLFFMMTYVFQQNDRVLYSGFTVFGDYAPHTAMMRSFSRHANYPTQYPHFGGADVKYHFMFQFLTGNLEYLGMRLDIAYNLVSTLSLWGFLVMLFQMAYRISGRFLSQVLTGLFFMFRSGTAFFRFAFEHLRAGDLLETLLTNTAFIGYTPNEDWGLWNFNVYLNQRHLGFGLLIAVSVMWIFMNLFERGVGHEENGLSFLKGRIFDKNAWKIRYPERALMTGMILGLCSFWNGACVIGGLLILCGMALFSDGKADYLILAGTAIAFSWIESKLFIYGQAVSAGFYWGFLSESKSLPGVLLYLFQITGLTVLGLVIALPFLKRRERCLTISFLFPLIFAFCFSLTPDINVNHKYIIISMAFLAVIWADLISGLTVKQPEKDWRFLRNAGVRHVIAVLLVICLTATGIYDFVVILKDNDKDHRVGVYMDSELTEWLSDNLTEKDLVLTPEYALNEVTMSGMMMYMGWPYFGWSAGYDTYGRAEKAKLIYSTTSPALLTETVGSEKITHILYETGMTYEEQSCREDVIASVYPCIFTSEDGRIRIYETGIIRE